MEMEQEETLANCGCHVCRLIKASYSSVPFRSVPFRSVPFRSVQVRSGQFSSVQLNEFAMVA